VRGRPTLSFKLVAGKNAPSLSTFTILLPRGLSITQRRAGKRLQVTGVSVTGAKLKSVSLRHGHLVISLRRAVTSLAVKIRARALKESGGLRFKAAHHQIKSLRLKVVIRDSAHRSTTLATQIKKLHL
jgi:hypothetical protein